MRRLSEPIVFLKFEISCVFADSPIARCFGPNETRALYQAFQCEVDKIISKKNSYGVARLDTSFVIMSIPRFRATPI